MKDKEVREKERVKVISAKISESLYAECEEIRDKLKTGTMNELVRRALILYLNVHDKAAQTPDTTRISGVYRDSIASNKTQFTGDSGETDNVLNTNNV